MAVGEKRLLAYLAIIVAIVSTVAATSIALTEMHVENKRKEFDIRTELRTEMVDTISRPLAVAQQLEEKIRMTSTHPIDFIEFSNSTDLDNVFGSSHPSESDNLMISNANLELLQNNKIVREKLRTYFDDQELLNKWDNLSFATYHFDGLTLVINPIDRESKLSGIWGFLEDASDSKVVGNYIDEFSSAEGKNVKESRINIDIIPYATMNLTRETDENKITKIDGVVDAVEILKHRENGSHICQEFHNDNSSYCVRFHQGLYGSAWNMIRNHILDSENQLGTVVLNLPVKNLP